MASAAGFEADWSILSAAERARAGRFGSTGIAWPLLAPTPGIRLVLAALLGREATSLHFADDELGKPRLGLDGPHLPPFFNLSHSHGLAALAIASAFDLGVDIGRVRVIEQDLVQRFLSERECADLSLLPTQRRRLAFFNIWIRKEAYLKALRPGLSVPLCGFNVSLAPGEPARLCQAEGDKDRRLRVAS